MDTCGSEGIALCVLDFGTFFPSWGATLAVTLFNNGDLPVQIQSIELDDPSGLFSITSAVPGTIDPRPARARQVHVTFGETTSGFYSATLRITTDAPNVAALGGVITIELRALVNSSNAGFVDVSPRVCVLGAVGSERTCTVTVRPRYPLTLIGAEIQAAAGGSMQVLTQDVPRMLLGGREAPLVVSVEPAGAVPVSGALMIYTDAPGWETIQIPVQGVGADAPFAVALLDQVRGLPVGARPDPLRVRDAFVVSGEQSHGRAVHSIERYWWDLVRRPEASSAYVAEPDSARTGLAFIANGVQIQGADVPGEYVFKLRVMDDGGQWNGNEELLTVDVSEADYFMIEMTHDQPLAGVMMHLLREPGERFSEDDCYSPMCNRDGGAETHPYFRVRIVPSDPLTIGLREPSGATYSLSLHYFLTSVSQHPTVGLRILRRGEVVHQEQRVMSPCGLLWNVARLTAGATLDVQHVNTTEVSDEHCN